MSLYSIIVTVFIIYMLINVGIGIYGRRHAKTMNEFLTTSRQSSFWFIVCSAVGASIGSGVVMGTTQYAASLGMAAAWYAFGCGLAGIVYSLLMVKFIYRNNLMSFSDYFKKRYSGKFIVFLYSGVGPFAMCAGIGAQILAGKTIFEAFGMDGNLGVVLIAAVVLIYTLFSGLWGSYATAVFQVAVIIVGLVWGIITMALEGGFDAVYAAYPGEQFNLFNLSPSLWVLFVVPMVLSVLIDQSSVQRVNAARTEKAAFWGHFLSFIPMVLVGLIMVFLGMWGQTSFPDAAGGASFIMLMMDKFPPIVCAIFISAILAAIMSTASAAFIASDALVVHDLYQGYINKNASEKQMKTINNVLNIVLAGGAVLFATTFVNIIELLAAAYTIMISGCLIPLLGGLIWKRGTTTGAAAAAICGIATVILTMTGLIAVPFDSIFPLLPALVAYIVVSLLSHDKSKAEEKPDADAIGA